MPERALDLLDRRLRRRDRLELLVVEEVGARELGLVEALRGLAGRGRALEALGDAGELVVGLRRGLRLAGDDERRRASSTRIESTSSTIAYEWLRWTTPSSETAMLSRR